MYKNIIVYFLIGILMLSVTSELFALYAGLFDGNNIPVVTHIFNCVLVLLIFKYSADERKPKKIYFADRSRLKRAIEKQAEKYYMSSMSSDKDIYNTPDTKDIWITPDQKQKYYSTMDFDDTTLQLIKSQRYKSAAEHLNSLQDNKKDIK